MRDLTPLPPGSDEECDCGRVASWQLRASCGLRPRPVLIPLCTVCAALEAGATPRQLLAVYPAPSLCPSPMQM